MYQDYVCISWPRTQKLCAPCVRHLKNVPVRISFVAVACVSAISLCLPQYRSLLPQLHYCCLRQGSFLLSCNACFTSLSFRIGINQIFVFKGWQNPVWGFVRSFTWIRAYALLLESELRRLVDYRQLYSTYFDPKIYYCTAAGAAACSCCFT